MRLFGTAILALLLCGVNSTLRAQASADVVVVVDTSTSISQRGMDPERTSLLVAKLLTDLVPGKLAVIRSLDVSKDKAWLPSRDTGITVPCSEDPSKQCHKVEPQGDWYHEVRVHQYGAIARPSRGDAGFKAQLDEHLAQVINNSNFGLSFRAAQGVFDSHGASPDPRSIIWLSDGGTDDEQQLEAAVQDLRSAGVSMEAVIFGQGSTDVANRLGLHPSQVRSPADLMKAFAEAFRHIVGAPYKLDNLVSAQPSFDMKPHVDEAWVVVYGDASLGEVTLETPGGVRRADYAQDSRAGAGAYKVLYATSPPAGRWTVHVTGGGPGAAYAVVQRSALQPVLLEPASAVAGVPVQVSAGLSASAGTILTPNDFPEPVTMTLEVAGRTYPLTANGTDGRYSAMVTFDNPGDAEVTLHAKSENIIDRTVKAKIPVSGLFRYHGGPLLLDLGLVKAGQKGCAERTLSDVEHQGAISFLMKPLMSPPAGETLDIEEPGGILTASGNRVPIRPGQPIRVCVSVGRRAGSFEAQGEQWLELDAAGMNSPESRVPIRLKWRVQPLSFWELWGTLILGVLLLLGILFFLYGFIKPERFQRNLAVIFVPERSEIEEQSPQPITQWKGVGIGWYRDARAYLHGNFRISPKSAGALASLHAVRGGTRVDPAAGGLLYRETSDLEWEQVNQNGRRAATSDVFRVGERGPYFKISVRRG